VKDLREYLQSIPFIRKEDIFPIPVQHPQVEESLRKAKRASAPKPKTQTVVKNADYRRRYRIVRWIAFILAVCVVAMFAITATTNNTTVLNYENQLINKYEAWEERLDQRQEAIEAKEKELGIMPE